MKPKENAPLKPKENAPPSQSNVVYPCFCVGVFAALLSIPLLFAFVYHSFPSLVALVIVAILVAALLPLHATHGPSLAGGLAATVVVTVAIGLHCYYAYAVPLRSLIEGRSYNNVFASLPAVAFADASVISFAGNATVDTSRAIGMANIEAGAHTYCVAPITDATTDGRAQFWAVGIDCCGHMGDFECDDAGEGGHGGLVLPDEAQDRDALYGGLGKFLAPPLMRRDIFLRAIRHAEAAHGVTSSMSPVLIQWTKAKRSAMEAAARSILAGSLVGCAVFVGIASFALTSVAFFAGSMRISKQRQDSTAAANAGFPLHTPSEVVDFVQAVAPGSSASCTDALVFGLVVPVLAVVASSVLWSWIRCLRSMDIIFAIYLGLAATTSGTLLLTPRRSVYGLWILIANLVGAFVGDWNYANNVSHYCAVVNRRSYADVRADSSANEYRDAGKIHFEPSAAVDVAHSLGYLYRGVNYCAAPIFAPSSSPSTSSASNLTGFAESADFWAVGRGCCGSRGKFTCGAERDAGQVGLTVFDAGITDDKYKGYMRAVRAAADTYSISRPKTPILVRWGGDLNAIRDEWLGAAVNVILAAAGVSFVGSAILVGLAVLYANVQEKIETKEIAKNHV
jgi:hypothetical protein